MEVMQGTCRAVFLFNSFVLKFCRPQPLWYMLDDIWTAIFRLKDPLAIPYFVREKWHYFRKGIQQNLSERKCWKACHAGFLTPTYLSLGIVNIQKREYGWQLTKQELRELLARIFETTSDLNKVDPHCLSGENFRVTAHGYRLVDYGDNTTGKEMSVVRFILKYQDKLTSVLCKTVPPAE